MCMSEGFRCADCGYNCHEKCRPLVPKDCHEFVSFDIPEGDAVATNAADDFSDMVMLSQCVFPVLG